MRLAIFEPDIPQNTGAMLRTAACLGVQVDIIGPAGFIFSDRRLRRAGMDYLKSVELTRHDSWASFLDSRANSKSRLVLLTTTAAAPYGEFLFMADDTLVVGRESAGAPDAVHAACGGAVRIPMAPGARSLNVAVAAAMALGEALRQTGMFPSSP